MNQKTIVFHSRSLLSYYALFFAGGLVLLYQIQNWSLVGDPVNFLCLLTLIMGLGMTRWIHFIENVCLLTLGYVLPLFIRNCVKLSYMEAPSMGDLIQLGLKSFVTTIMLVSIFTVVGGLLAYLFKRTLASKRAAKGSTSLLKD